MLKEGYVKEYAGEVEEGKKLIKTGGGRVQGRCEGG